MRSHVRCVREMICSAEGHFNLPPIEVREKLPQKLLDASLPCAFFTVCTFLRYSLKSVRMSTGNILKKIKVCLDPKHFGTLNEHFQTLLTKGFRLHVLSVTIHGTLDALRNLPHVSLNDIFGEFSMEKEVDRLVFHTPESKPSAKAFLVLFIIARIC